MTKYKLVEGAGAFRARRFASSAGECRHAPRKARWCLQSGGPALSISTSCRAGYHRCSCAEWRINSHRAAWLMWQIAARDGPFTTELTPASLVAPEADDPFGCA
jgi:hypothetical protein